MEKSYQLIDDLSTHSGLSKECITGELRDVLALVGSNPENFTLEQLQEALAQYLMREMLQAKELPEA